MNFPAAEEDKLRTRAAGLGLSLAGYVGQVVRDALRTRSGQDTDPYQTELLKAVRALVPTLAEAFGRTQNVNQETIEKLSAALLDRYEKSR